MNKTRVYNGFVKVDLVETDQGTREVVQTTDAVGMLIYDSVNDVVLLVEQSRAPMISDNNPSGTTVEVAAGRFDHEVGIRELVVKEVKEELGVTITEDEVELLNNGKPLAVSPGAFTEKIYLAFVEVKPEKINQEEGVYGNSEEGEQITRLFVPVLKLGSMKCDDLKTFALIQWFLTRQK